MRNALIRKIIFTLLIIGIASNLQGEYRKQMLVPYHSQKTSKWCWAASMQMIMEFHKTRIANQSNLVKRLVKISNPGLDTFNIDCCTECPRRNTGTEPPCLYGFEREAMPFTNETLLSPLPDMFDLIFSSYDYNSMQQVNQTSQYMTWEEVKKEIDDCRPFIINMEPRAIPVVNNDNNSISINQLGNHTIVVTGYRESIAGNFVITNDPWVPCSTATVESLFPYEVFTTTGFSYTPDGGTDYFVNRVLSVVHHIYPIDIARLADCKSCPSLYVAYGNSESYMEVQPAERLVTTNVNRNVLPFSQQFNPPPTDTSRLIELLERNASKVVGFNQPVLKDSAYQAFLKQENNNYYDTQVSYVSLNKLNGTSFWSRLFPPCRLPKVLDEGYEIREIVSAVVDEKVVSTFQKAKGNVWVLRKITNQTPIRKNIELKFTGKKQNAPAIQLSNLKEKPLNAVSYKIIRTFPLYYEFYSFKLNPNDKDFYLSPVQDYPALGLKKGYAYTEAQSIKPIRKEIRSNSRVASPQVVSQEQLMEGAKTSKK